ncbi:MAG: DUF5658 family protein [Clostridium sp.]|uniref:DUF5658 family protein n=1 Tax=Clostridium sp. TaxID=1506 RepID=UPI003F2ECB00
MKLSNVTYDTVKRNFRILYLLNITDYIFTVTLVSTGEFEEGNVLMESFIANPLRGLVLKVFIIGLIIKGLIILFKKANESELRKLNFISIISLAIYGGINLLHIYYSIYYIKIASS